ncbi:MAG: glycosyltransferase family 1 protein, partial [Deltaproteobacteria bacterium]|nr:glycosyltransferase family 1 protein [Deltaproteobacteria bacterium]
GTHTQVLGDDMACLVAPDAEAMADGIIRLLHDPTLCQRLGENGRKRVAEDFSPAAYRKKLERFYKTIMGKIAVSKGQD